MRIKRRDNPHSGLSSLDLYVGVVIHSNSLLCKEEHVSSVGIIVIARKRW